MADHSTQLQDVKASPDPREERRSRTQAFWEWLGFGKDATKTGLDLLQVLAAVSIPVAVVIIGANFTASQSRSQQQAEEQRAQAQLELEEQRAQDVALQSYFEQMSQLLLEEDLRESKPGSEVRSLARSRTLTILRGLDGDRKGSLVQFLNESSLITKTNVSSSLSQLGSHEERMAAIQALTPSEAVISLAGADLSGANLTNVSLLKAELGDTDLSGADLSRAYLVDIDLKGADLSGADLSGAKLNNSESSPSSAAPYTEAELTRADLSNAILRDATISQEWLDRLETTRSLQGAIMPDGSKHD